MQLPLNCEATYYKEFLESQEAQNLFMKLMELMKQVSFNPQTVDGKKYDVNFNKIMFVDQDLLEENKFPEEQWGAVRGWFEDLKRVKVKIEDHTGNRFQVCVLIYYPDGNSGVDFHSDFTAFGDTSLIPSLSLGEERTFTLREKESGKEFSTELAHGSLIIMGEHCQERYEHSLPIDPIYKNPRINLTFRKYGFEN